MSGLTRTRWPSPTSVRLRDGPVEIRAGDGSTPVHDELEGTLNRGSLVMYGDIFGGRIDNIHTAVGATAEPDGSLVVRFDQDETLIVWNPMGGAVSPVEFRVDRASSVRWEWFCNGSPKIEENRRFIDHRIEDGRVRVTTDLASGTADFAPSLSRPAVELIGWT